MSENGKKRKRRGERKDGRILVTTVIGYNDESGQPIRMFFYGRTRAEAEQKRKEYLDSSKAGINLKDRDITVSEWIEKWIDLYEVRIDEYAPYISRIKTEFGNTPVKDITEGMLIKSLRQYKGKSKSGATKYRMILKQIFHTARRNHIINDDPSEDLKLPEVTEGSHRSLERWEIEAIINNWRIHPAGRWAMIMLLCGLRRGEMAALMWDCIDIPSRTLTVRRAASFKNSKTVINDQTKTEAGMRTLPICDELLFMLLETPEDKRKGFVCLSSTGKQISATSAQRNWKTYCSMMSRVLSGKNAVLKGFRSDLYKVSSNLAETEISANKREFSVQAHDLRHTYATMLYMAGIDIKAAQYYLGHSDIRMTMSLYTHLTAEAEANKRTQLTGYLDSYLLKK